MISSDDVAWISEVVGELYSSRTFTELNGSLVDSFHRRFHGVVTLKGNGQQVLVVDDDEGLCKVVKRMVEKLGYKPVAFTESTDALAAFRASPTRYNVVLTDLTMPHLSGIELARQIGTIRSGTPVVIASGNMPPNLVEQARAAGVTHFAMKPYTMEEIATTLRSALEASITPPA